MTILVIPSLPNVISNGNRVRDRTVGEMVYSKKHSHFMTIIHWAEIIAVISIIFAQALFSNSYSAAINKALSWSNNISICSFDKIFELQKGTRLSHKPVIKNSKHHPGCSNYLVIAVSIRHWTITCGKLDFWAKGSNVCIWWNLWKYNTEFRCAYNFLYCGKEATETIILTHKECQRCYFQKLCLFRPRP